MSDWTGDGKNASGIFWQAVRIKTVSSSIKKITSSDIFSEDVVIFDIRLIIITIGSGITAVFPERIAAVIF